MAGKKDKAVVAVISNLTTTQANNLVCEIGKAKAKVAPGARGTAISGNKSDVPQFINSGASAPKITKKGD